MTEEWMIQSYAETTIEHARDGLGVGIPPLCVANIMMAVAIQLAQEVESRDMVVASLQQAAEALEARP